MEQRQGKELKEFNSIYQELDGIYHEIALHMGLSDSAFLILYAVAEFGEGFLQKDITAHFFVSKQTVHSAVGALEKKGLLELRRGKRREMHMYLTAAGRQFVEEKIAPVQDAENLVFTEMGEDERREFLRLGRKYTALLREKTGEKSI